jgi:hypothetical protein
MSVCLRRQFNFNHLPVFVSSETLTVQLNPESEDDILEAEPENEAISSQFKLEQDLKPVYGMHESACYTSISGPQN